MSLSVEEKHCYKVVLCPLRTNYKLTFITKWFWNGNGSAHGVSIVPKKTNAYKKPATKADLSEEIQMISPDGQVTTTI